MSFTLEIDATDALELAAKYEGATKVLATELETAMVRTVAVLQLDIQTAAPVWQGNARRSVTTTASATKGTVGTNLVHAIVQLETGRAAGAPMPPQGSLLAWMAWKKIPAEREFLIRRAIARKGIPAKHLFTKALAENRSAIDQEFRASLQRVIARLSS